MVNPLASYLLKVYSKVVATLWASTFALAVLFIPKLYMFWKRCGSNATEVNIEKQLEHGADQQQHSFLKSSTVYDPEAIDVSDLRRNAVDYSSQEPEQAADNDQYHGRYDNTNVYVEVQEVIALLIFFNSTARL